MTEPYISEEQFLDHLRLIDRSPKVAVDTEGTINHPHSKTWGLSTSAQGQSEYFAFNHFMPGNLPAEWLPKMKQCLENHPHVVMHHAKHDIRALRNLDIHIKNFTCTMMKAHMVNENFLSKELDYLSRHFGGDPKRNSEVQKQIIKAFGWEWIPIEIIRPYGANDALITNDLDDALEESFVEQGFNGELWNWEQKFTRFLIDIEDQGILIDQDHCQRELERGTAIMEDIKKYLGFNPGSSDQLGRFLIDELGLPVLKRSKKTGKPSMDKTVMKQYDLLLSRQNDKRAQVVLRYRGWAKTTGSNYKPYLELLHEDGRLHANYKQHGTHTGRLSCEMPNLQQIPKSSEQEWNGRLKQAFIVAQGRTAWEFDYGQLEFRLGSAYGRVKSLLDIFADPSRDIFTEMGKDLGMHRDNVKTLVYTIQFGGGAGRIRDVFDVDLSEAQQIKNNFYRRYPGLLKVSKLAEARARQRGWVAYWTGRRRHFYNVRDEAHKAFNSVIQGGAFEITKRQMCRLKEEGLHNDECRIDLQVHDSIRADIEEGKEHIYVPEIKRVMEDVKEEFGVVFKMDVKRWGTKEKWDDWKERQAA